MRESAAGVSEGHALRGVCSKKSVSCVVRSRDLTCSSCEGAHASAKSESDDRESYS